MDLVSIEEYKTIEEWEQELCINGAEVLERINKNAVTPCCTRDGKILYTLCKEKNDE